MFDTPTTRRRLKWSAGAFLAVWIPGSIVLGLNWGSRLRFGGDDPSHAGPVVEGLINMAALMLGPSLFVGLIVFVFHAWRTER